MKAGRVSVIDLLFEYCCHIPKTKLKLAMKYGAVWLICNNKKATRIRKVKKILSKGDKLSILVRIDSGRKHQIRKHLAIKGFPIIGDRLYGGAEF